MTVLFKFILFKNILDIINLFTNYDEDGYLIEDNNDLFDEEVYDDYLDDGFGVENDDTIDSGNIEE